MDTAANTPKSGPGGGLMPLVRLRRRWPLGIVAFVLVLALGVPFAWLKGTPRYQVTGSLVIAPKFASVLRDDRELDLASTTQYKQFVEQQMRTINRYDLMLTVLERLGDKRYVWWQREGESDRRAAERLQGALQIRNLQLNYLVLVSLEGGQAEGLAEIINTVLAVYLDVGRSEILYASDERIAVLQKRAQEALDAIATDSERRSAIAQQLGVTTFTADTPNPFDALLLETRRALDDSQRRRHAAEARLAAIDPQQGKAAQAALNALAQERISSDYGLNSLKASLLGKRGDLLEKISGLAPQHPERIVIERKLNELSAELSVAEERSLTANRQMLLDKQRSEVRELQTLEASLSAELTRQQERASTFASRYAEALALSDAIDRQRRQLQTVQDRIDYLRLESEAPGFVRLDSAARPPLFPSGGGRKKLLMLVAAAAGFLALAVPIGIDLLDRRIRMPGQLFKLLGFAPLATLVEAEDAVSQRLYDEQLRQLVIHLQRNRARHELRLLTLAGLDLGSGSTRLVLELAEQFARDGLRVLALDLNPLHPDPAYGMGPGVRELLYSSQLQVPPAPERPCAIRLPLGGAGSPHLERLDRLRQLLAELRVRFDLVLLDAPPVLLSADATLLASLADATLLIVAAGTEPGLLKRGIGLLQRADPAHFGVVFNRAPLYRGGGYFLELANRYTDLDARLRARVPEHEN